MPAPRRNRAGTSTGAAARPHCHPLSRPPRPGNVARSMYVSIHLSPQSRGDAEDLETIEELVDHALAADAAGAAAVCLTEHHIAGFNTYCDPFLMGMYLAPRITQAYLAVHVVQVPFHNPVRIAEQANMLDLVTRGRCMIALAPGSPRQIELDVFGVDMADKAGMTRERIAMLRRIWGRRPGDPPLDVSTPHDRGILAGRISPGSFRKPHPLVGRATTTDATIVEAARLGWPTVLALRGDDAHDGRQAALYRSTLEESGHDDETVRECLSWLSLTSLVSVASTEREARRRQEEYVRIGGVGPIVTSADEGTQEWAEEWRARQLQRADWAVVGTPEVIAEHLLAYRGIGVEHARVALVTTPGRPEQNREELDLFLQEVLPLLDPQQLPGPARTVETEAAEAAAAPRMGR